MPIKSPAQELERTEQFGIQSVEVAGGLLEAMLRSEGPAKLAELARSAGMPSAKAHRYLVSLIRIGLATQDPTTGLYDLGSFAFQLGLKGFTRFEPLRLAETMMRQLVDEVGETVALAVWSERGPVMIRVIEARHEFAATVAPSHACPLTYSATGLLFCTFEDPARTANAIKRELEQNRVVGRPNAPYNRTALAELIHQTRTRGLSSVGNGGGDGISAVSAPVLDMTGTLRMAVTIFGRAGRIDAGPNGALGRLVATAAQRLSASLGYKALQT